MIVKQKNILLVEDDYLDAMNVKRIFAKLNFSQNLQVALNGKEAVDLLEGQTGGAPFLPDIILLDLNMPKMNGIEFLSYLRGKDKYKAVKVFVITTSDEESDKTRTRQFDISGFINKPLSLERFNNPSDSMDNFNLLCELITR